EAENGLAFLVGTKGDSSARWTPRAWLPGDRRSLRATLLVVGNPDGNFAAGALILRSSRKRLKLDAARQHSRPHTRYLQKIATRGFVCHSISPPVQERLSTH